MADTSQDRLDRRLELAATLLLAIAAVATAWAAYQSARWHSEQAKGQSASIAARVESTRAANVANRQAQVDVALFTQWADAYARDETELVNFYDKRFRDEFRPAFEAWVATRPRTNPNAPLSPFAMPQYKLAANAQADRLEAQAAAASDSVGSFIQRADNYSLAVVLFAASLFFAGISTRLRSPTHACSCWGSATPCFSAARSGSRPSRSACRCRAPPHPERMTRGHGGPIRFGV